jgi:cobalamin biosynthesis Mg chelatase CobN
MMGVRLLAYPTGGRDENLQRSSRMADPQDRPEDAPGAAPADQTPPTAKPPQKAAKKTPAKKAPAKAAKTAKKAPKAAAKKAPAKKSPDKKPAAKKTTPAKAEPSAKPTARPPSSRRGDTNGQFAAGAKEAAAQAKSTVETADSPVPPATALPGAARSPVPLVLAVVIGLITLLLIRQLRRR